MAKRPLVIVGGGGFGREVIWLARTLRDEWSLEGVLDDDPSMRDSLICGVRVLGPVSSWHDVGGAWFVAAIGSPRTRRKVVERMKLSGAPRFATLVHATAVLSEHVTLGEGCLVCAGSILTTQVLVGDHTVVNLGVTVGHDVTIGEFCTLHPQAALSGGVGLGSAVEVGSGAVVTPGVSLGSGSLVCAGAVVTKPVASNALVAGAPARRVRTLDPL